MSTSNYRQGNSNQRTSQLDHNGNKNNLDRITRITTPQITNDPIQSHLFNGIINFDRTNTPQVAIIPFNPVLGNWTIGHFGQLSKTLSKTCPKPKPFFNGQVLDKSCDLKINFGQNYN